MAACDARGKARYTDLLSAARAARALTRRKEAVRPYGCKDCGGWHLTSKPASSAYLAKLAAHPDGPEALRILAMAESRHDTRRP